MSRSLLGAVLAGGASSRFGSDKALAMADGLTLLDRAAAAIAPFVAEVVVVGRAGEVSDAPMPGLGPLGGIAGSLVEAERRGFASVLTIACDMPVVPAELVAALVETVPAYCADAPVLGHWSAALAHGLIALLSSNSPSPRPCAGVHSSASSPTGESKAGWMPGRARHDGKAGLPVRRWAEAIGAVPIPSPVPLANVNTPADLAAL